MVRKKLDLLDTLCDIEIASSLMQEAKKVHIKEFAWYRRRMKMIQYFETTNLLKLISSQLISQVICTNCSNVTHTIRMTKSTFLGEWFTIWINKIKIWFQSGGYSWDHTRRGGFQVRGLEGQWKSHVVVAWFSTHKLGRNYFSGYSI